MGVVAVDGLVGEPVDEIGRLDVVRDLANGHHAAVAVDLTLLELNGDATVGDVADVAVVQRIEMRDVEQVPRSARR